VGIYREGGNLMDTLNFDQSGIQKLTMGSMNCNFPRETLSSNLTIEYLKTWIDMKKSLTPSIEKTLLRKSTIGNNTRVTIVMLDKDNRPLYESADIPIGVEITVPGIDVEITNLFNNKDSVIRSI
jgi:hypothetical protein